MWHTGVRATRAHDGLIAARNQTGGQIFGNYPWWCTRAAGAAKRPTGTLLIQVINLLTRLSNLPTTHAGNEPFKHLEEKCTYYLYNPVSTLASCLGMSFSTLLIYLKKKEKK